MNRHKKALEILKSGTAIPANPLALDENRQFDEKGQRLLTRYYLNAGSGGIAVAVHTTQFEIRLPQYNLYEAVLKIAGEEVDKYELQTGKTIVKVAGVCGEIEQAVKEAQASKGLGYDAVLLSPGGLNHLSEDDMLKRTKAVAKVMPVIGFYLQTAVGGRVFSFDYWRKTTEIENVVAIKCASFNRYTTLDVVRAVALSSRSEDIALYTGNDDNIVIDLLTKYKFMQDGKAYEKQFVGGLLGHWSVWTKKSVDMFWRLKQASMQKNISAELLTLSQQVTDTNAAFFDTANNFKGCIAGLHEILRRQGIMKGVWCLNPDEVMSQGQESELNRVCAMYPELSDDEFIKENLQSWKENL